MYDHVMVDLETMSTSPNAAIVAIGAVKFDPQVKSLGDTFYCRVSLKSVMDLKFDVSADTILWWFKQSDDARKSTFEGEVAPICTALSLFSDFLGRDYNFKVWGNGSDFDNVILANAYNKCEADPPWKFYNNRCFRTLKSLSLSEPLLQRTIQLPPSVGVKHNALDDAIYQAKYAVELVSHLGVRSK